MAEDRDTQLKRTFKWKDRFKKKATKIVGGESHLTLTRSLTGFVRSSTENLNPFRSSSRNPIPSDWRQDLTTTIGAPDAAVGSTLSTSAKDIHTRVKARWKQTTSIEKFGELAEWSDETIKFYTSASIGSDAKDIIADQTRMYYNTVREFLNDERNFNMSIFPSLEEDFDGCVALFALLVKVNPIVQRSKINEYKKLITEVYDTSESDLLAWKQNVEEALLKGLAADIAPTADDYVEEIWNTIHHNFRMYTSSSHLSPYVSIVGPSGTGKTRAMEELARRKLCYVSYLNLASDGAITCPKRSVIADRIATIHDRSELTTFFECYIASILQQVLICKELGINERAFWDLQTLDQHRTFQAEVAQHVANLCAKAWTALDPDKPTSSSKKHFRIKSKSQGEENEPFNYREYIDQFIGSHKSHLKKTFENIMGDLRESNMSNVYFCTKDPSPSLREDTLECIICLDETRDLFPSQQNETIDMSRYGALRRAFRHQATGQDKKKSLQFFGVVTDTTSRVSDLSPAKPWDSSLKASRRAFDLFKPIWEIETFDIFCDAAQYQNLRVANNGGLSPQDHCNLFSLGRPLWGSLLKEIRIEEVQKFIINKLDEFHRGRIPGEGKKAKHTEITLLRDLALLSYRCSFHVNLQALSELLASNYLHFIADISPERTLVRTMQPSEPILAWVASQEMGNSSKRLSVIKSVFYHSQRGFIDVGDVGELVAIIILLFTFDRALGPHLPQPVTLSAFIKNLLPTLSEKIEAFISDSEKLTQIWRDGSIFFNHFSRTERRLVTMQTLRRAYGRCSALIAPRSFEGIDLVIPVFLGEKGMSYLLIQVKNDKSLDLTPSLKKKAAVSLKPHEKLDRADFGAYFGILMSLRGEKKTSGTPRRGKGKQRLSSVEETSSKKGLSVAELVLPADLEEHEEEREKLPADRLHIVSAGLDVYPVLHETPEMVDTLFHLLDCNHIINVPDRSKYLESLFPIDLEPSGDPMDLD